MLNGNFIKVDRVIEGVYRDYGWTHEIDWIDCLEWVGECMDLIGAPKNYVDKITDGNEEINHPCPIVIKNYRGHLPCDMVYVVQAREAKTKIPLRYTTDSFHEGLEKSEANIPAADLNWFGSENFTSPFVVSKNLLKDANQSDLTYKLTDCYIFTNFEEGEVELAYKAFPSDENGYPMIPDNIKYIQAVKSYIAERIGFRMFIQGKMQQGIYSKLEQERMWYIGAATTAGHLPSMDEMESWKNQFVRLIPNLNFHSDGFKYMGDQQRQINHNSI